jgi:hypothetical protein
MTATAGVERWVLVPRDATPEMLEVIQNQRLAGNQCSTLYWALLAAAPSPPAAQGDEVVEAPPGYHIAQRDDWSDGWRWSCTCGHVSGQCWYTRAACAADAWETYRRGLLRHAADQERQNQFDARAALLAAGAGSGE